MSFRFGLHRTSNIYKQAYSTHRHPLDFMRLIITNNSLTSKCFVQVHILVVAKNSNIQRLRVHDSMNQPQIHNIKISDALIIWHHRQT